MEERIIGRYETHEKGPLLICIGGIHGNEPAGVKAIGEVLKLLAIEPIKNPGFNYKGTFVGVRGNLTALRDKKRFVDRDLNRMLSIDETSRIRRTPSHEKTTEDGESIELIDTIELEINTLSPEFTLILDFHTTTADGGLFTISADDPESRKLAQGLHAPVILGIAEGLIGTTIEYFNRPFSNCYCIVFEAGQHEDPGCVDRMVAAIVNCMRSIGSVRPKDVDHRHDDILISLSKGLPKLSRLIYHYKLQPGEKFVMNPGYTNFHPVIEGEELASNESGIIRAPYSGLMLMPKYQVQGEDGFFIIEPINS